MTPEQRAEKLTRDLFTDGDGHPYTHLSMDNAPRLGWGKGPVKDKIKEAIEAAVTDAQASAFEQCASIAEDIAEGRHQPFVREAGHAIRAASPDPAFIDLVRSEAQAEMVEACALIAEGFDAEFVKFSGYNKARDDIAEEIRKLSPSPNSLARKLLEARLEAAKAMCADCCRFCPPIIIDGKYRHGLPGASSDCKAAGIYFLRSQAGK